MSDYSQSVLDELFFEADNLIKDKHFPEAIQKLEAILTDDPTYGKAYNHLGWIYETQYRDYIKSEELYRKCIAISPNYTSAYGNLSITLSTLNKLDEQEKLLHQALTVPGIDKPMILNEFGIMYEMKGDFDKAIEHYKKAIIASLNDANIEIYSKSVERCKKKKEMMKM
jgi:tetratricopeptide (TPR) repeat protein